MKRNNTRYQVMALRLSYAIKEARYRLYGVAAALRGHLKAFAQSVIPIAQIALKRELAGLLIATPETYEWACAIERYVVDEMEALYPGTCVNLQILFVEGDDTDIHNALTFHPALTGEQKERFSFVVTPGYTATRIVHDLRKSFELSILQVYCMESALVMPEIIADESTGGVCNTPMAGIEYAQVLAGIMPHARMACLVFTPHSGFSKSRGMVDHHRRMVASALREIGIAVTEHYWEYGDANSLGLVEKVNAADVIITFDEPAAYKHCKELVRLCEAQKKVLCASELDSVLKGAALGCGITKQAYSRPLVSVLHDLLMQRSDAFIYQIPMQVGMRYNLPAMRRQGLELSGPLAAIMRLKSVYDPHCIDLHN